MNLYLSRPAIAIEMEHIKHVIYKHIAKALAFNIAPRGPFWYWGTLLYTVRLLIFTPWRLETY